MCQVDVIANSLVLYLPFCSTLNKNFFSLLSSSLHKEVLNCTCVFGTDIGLHKEMLNCACVFGTDIAWST